MLSHTPRLVLIAIALLALVVVPTLGHTQPRNEDDYVFLVKRFALVKNESVVNGNIGVQNARGKLKVGRVASVLGLGVGDRVFLNAGVTVSEVFANTLKFNPAKTFPGPVTQPVPLPVYVTEPLVVPDPFDPANFPPDFPIGCGGVSKKGDKNEVFALPPGAYGAVKVAQGGRLVLSAGTYNFCLLEAVRGDIEVAGPVTINVRDKFGLGNQASLLPNAPLGADDVQVNFAGKSIRISAGSRFTGRIFAPEGQIRLGRQAVVIGHLVSDKLRSDKGFTAFPPADAAVCGNGMLQGAETCDPPGVAVPPNQNVCRVGCTFCGDNLVQSGEDCDDGNSNNGDGCRNDCSFPPPPLCGNGAVDAPETCDPPGSDPPPLGGNLCRTDCSYCGDGTADAGEACDDGNMVDDDQCANSCTAGPGQQTLCGDDIVGPGETCDPPGSDPAPPGGNLCRVGCTYCGDGAQNGTEDCDDGNTVDDDACRNNCTLTPPNPCGNFQLDAGETCDPPGSDPPPAGGSLCRVNCTYCGDHSLQAGEECDDGNTDDLDSCANDCRINQPPMCGDGILDPEETCDPPGSDPMVPSGDLCGIDCTFCGDGTVDPGEQCDDGGDGDDPSDDGSSECDGSSEDSSSCGGSSDSESSDASSSDSASSEDSVSDNSSDCDGSSDGSSSCGGVSDSESSDDSSSDDSDSREKLVPCDDAWRTGGGDGDSSDCDGSSADSSSCGGADSGSSHDAGSSDDSQSSADPDDDSVECLDDCTLKPEAVCGDGEVNRTCETCDPPGSEIGWGGILCTTACTFCGDGNVDPGEECDPGEDDDSSDGGSSDCDGSSEDSSSCGGSSDSHSSDASSSGGTSSADDSSDCDGSSGDSSSCGGTSDSESSDDSSSDDSSSADSFCLPDCTLADSDDGDSSGCDADSEDSSSCGGSSDSQSSDASSSDDSSSDAKVPHWW